MRRVRVLMLIERIDPRGGAENLTRELALRLDPRRFEVTLCGTTLEPSLLGDARVRGVVEQCAAAGVRVVGLGGRLAWRRLAGELRRGRYDVVHTHMFRASTLGVPVARACGVPVVVAHEHTWHYEGWPSRRFVDREVIGRLADAFVAVSPHDARKMVEVERVDPAVVRWIPNGAPPLPPPTAGRDVRAELGIAPDAVVVGALGFLREQKRLDLLVRAAALVAPARPHVRFVLAGDGPQRGALEELASALGVRDALVFAGRRDDVGDVVRTFDAGVCCSDFEGTPLAVIEQLQAGVPMVATRVGGVPDLVVDGRTGLLVERGDVAGLAAAIGRVCDDRDLREQLGRGAADHARAFDIRETVGRLEALYAELLAARHSPHEAANVPRWGP